MSLLGPAEIRGLAVELDVAPTKRLGQNFVVDANTVRRIVRIAGVEPADEVLEVGPGLGSLTLGLLDVGARVTAIEIDPRLAAHLPETVAARLPRAELTVIQADALQVQELPRPPRRLVANLPYNVSVPVLLHLLERFPSLESALVMVQAEVGQRLAASPGSKTYGSPSVKAAWYGSWSLAGNVSRQVFWPVPNVDSVLVAYARAPGGPTGDEMERRATFAVVDAAFGQRRKTLRQALAALFGGADAAAARLQAAGIDPSTRGEQLALEDFRRIAQPGRSQQGLRSGRDRDSDGSFSASASKRLPGTLETGYAHVVERASAALGETPISARADGARPMARWRREVGFVLITVEVAGVGRLRVSAVHEGLAGVEAVEPAQVALRKLLASLVDPTAAATG